MKIPESSLKRVENTVGKGEIARYEQFLLFPQCFQKANTTKSQLLTTLWKRLYENIVEKGENAGFASGPV